MRASPALLDLPDDTAGHVIPCEKLGGSAGVAVSRHVAPPLLGRIRGLVDIERRNVVVHETAALGVRERAALSSHTLGHQDASHARWPHHTRRVELDELHVDQLRPRVVPQRVSVPCALPTVGRDLEGAPETAGGQDHRAGLKDSEVAALPIVPEGADHTFSVLEEPGDGTLLIVIEPLMYAVVLKRPDHLQAGTVTDVGEPRVGVTAEVPLKDFPILRPVENRSPLLEFPHSTR